MNVIFNVFLYLYDSVLQSYLESHDCHLHSDFLQTTHFIISSLSPDTRDDNLSSTQHNTPKYSFLESCKYRVSQNWVFFKYYINEILTTKMYMSQEILVKISSLYVKK